MLTTEELLRPRYKVIADYPGNLNPVGTILKIADCWKDFTIKFWCQSNDKYPHLFQPLPWWSDRESEQVEGLYIKCRDGRIGQIKKHVASDNGVVSLAFFKFDADDQVGHYYYNMHPEIATLAEYEAYNQQKEGMK